MNNKEKLTKNQQLYLNTKIAHLTIKQFITHRKVEVECDCGTIKTCDLYDLVRGKIKGCGCQRNNPQQIEIIKTTLKKLRSEGKMLSGYDNSDKLTPFRYLLKCISNKNRKPNLLSLVDLKEQWESQDGICPYSKIKLLLPTHSNHLKVKTYLYASVDRIDSALPYQKGNVQFVSRNINYAKGELSHDEFIEFLSHLK